MHILCLTLRPALACKAMPVLHDHSIRPKGALHLPTIHCIRNVKSCQIACPHSAAPGRAHLMRSMRGSTESAASSARVTLWARPRAAASIIASLTPVAATATQPSPTPARMQANVLFDNTNITRFPKMSLQQWHASYFE